MDNPGLLSIVQFLTNIESLGKANFSQISTGRAKGYGMASRYITFALKFDLIQIVETKTNSRGRYPSKIYSISDKGKDLIKMFNDIPEAPESEGKPPNDV